MFRAPGLIVALALCACLFGGAVWLRASLAGAFARGQAHGRALAAAQAYAQLAQRQAALDVVRRAAERDVAALEAEKDALREMLHDLEQQAALADAARPGAGGANSAPSARPVSRPPACLDAGLVRALDAIRRPAAGARAP